ncbi:MAG: DHH family phosphoesterase [Thermoplasmata archaeon]
MPSGPESFVAHPNYTAEFTRAREVLLGHPGRWRVIYHYDGDGIARASSAIRALRRLGYPFQATPFQGVERGHMLELLRATAGPVLIVDTGASWLDLYAEHPHPVLVLDHHTYPAQEVAGRLPGRVAFVNPLDWGVDGMSEMCAATLTWLFTIFLDPKNWDNTPWGISGAIADRQHVGGFRGLNRRLVEEAHARGLLEARPRLGLTGPKIGEALARSIDPYFRGLSGRPEAAAAFLSGLGIDPERSPTELSSAHREHLVEALAHLLVEQGVRPEFRELFREPGWFLPALGMDAEELSNLQNATGREGIPGIGIALALGDHGALDRARGSETAWRTGVLGGLRRIEDGGVKDLRALQWFESPDGALAGTQAGLAMNYLLDPRRPVVVVSPAGSGPIRVSARGTLHLVGLGLDLAVALREAAQAVGGEGGGHRVASGATVPAGALEEFLRHIDRIVSGQIPLGGATP